MNGFVNAELLEHATKVASGPYPTAALVPHRLMNLPEAKYAAESLFIRAREYAFTRGSAKRLKAFYADCCDVLKECQS